MNISFQDTFTNLSSAFLPHRKVQPNTRNGTSTRVHTQNCLSECGEAKLHRYSLKLMHWLWWMQKIFLVCFTYVCIFMLTVQLTCSMGCVKPASVSSTLVVSSLHVLFQLLLFHHQSPFQPVKYTFSWVCMIWFMSTSFLPPHIGLSIHHASRLW